MNQWPTCGRGSEPQNKSVENRAGYGSGGGDGRNKCGPQVRPKGGRPRQIICRFVFRDKMREFLVKKKQLNDQEDFKTIFMYDDLTPLRAKLLRAAKNHPNVRSAYTRDGIIHCNMQNGSQ